MRAIRIIVVGLGIVITAWFVLTAREAHDISVATDIVSQSSMTAEQAARAARLLSSASTLNPDRQVDILRAILAAGRNELRRAQRTLEAVGRSEPDNFEAWYVLAQLSINDATAEGLAFRHIAKLDPKVPAL